MKYIIVGVFALILSVTSVVPTHAEDGRPHREQLGSEIKEDIRNAHKENKAERDTLKAENKERRQEIKEMREDGATREEIKAKMEAVKEANEKSREEFRKTLEEKRKTLKDDIKAKIDAFKENKKQLKDDIKAKVEEKLDTIKTKLQTAVSKIEAFDKKISDIITSREEAGYDTSNAIRALETARQSLEETKVIVASTLDVITASLNNETGTSKEAIRATISDTVESIKKTKLAFESVIKEIPRKEAVASTTNQTN